MLPTPVARPLGRSAILRVSLLGPLRAAATDGCGIPSVVLADGRLLAFLLLHRDRAIRRDEAATALWPDLPRRAALDKLRRHIYLLHRQLPDHEPGRPWMTADRAWVGWNPAADLWLDAADFEENVAAAAKAALEPDPAAEEAALERASALYAGELLADVDGDWVLSERGRLHGLYRQVLERRLALRCAAGDAASAAAVAQLLAHLEPLREDACRMAMGLL